MELSQRRVCKALGLSRSLVRYKPKLADDEAELLAALTRVRHKHPTWGYRKTAQYLRNQGWELNDKRVERLWRQHGWQCRRPAPRKKAAGDCSNACHIRRATQGNEVWAVDFTQDKLANGQKVRMLTVLDEFTRETLCVAVAKHWTAQMVVEELSELFAQRGAPSFIRSDNGSEFTAKLVGEALKLSGCQVALIAPGSPWQNGKNERLNGILQQELLRRECFGSVLEAQVVVNQWRELYNDERPHGSLGMMTPNEYARQARLQGRWYNPAPHTMQANISPGP